MKYAPGFSARLTPGDSLFVRGRYSYAVSASNPMSSGLSLSLHRKSKDLRFATRQHNIYHTYSNTLQYVIVDLLTNSNFGLENLLVFSIVVD